MAEKAVSYQNCNTWLDVGTDDAMSDFPPFLPPAMKLGQGYIFTGVCDSVQRGRLLPEGGLLWGVPGGNPPGWLLLSAVRILLECILVVGVVVFLGYTPAQPPTLHF